MALPTSNPQGGLPTGPRQTGTSPKPAGESVSPLEEFIAREREQAAAKANAPKSVPAAASRPRKVEASEELEDGWRRDKKTGKTYKTIPKSEYDSEGNPILHLTDFDLDNLNGEAEKYLAHLRVASDPEERERLKQEKAARSKKSTAAYRSASQEDE